MGGLALVAAVAPRTFIGSVAEDRLPCTHCAIFRRAHFDLAGRPGHEMRRFAASSLRDIKLAEPFRGNRFCFLLRDAGTRKSVVHGVGWRRSEACPRAACGGRFPGSRHDWLVLGSEGRSSICSGSGSCASHLTHTERFPISSSRWLPWIKRSSTRHSGPSGHGEPNGAESRGLMLGDGSMGLRQSSSTCRREKLLAALTAST